MRTNGIAYDTGFVRHGQNSRDLFTPTLVRRELEIIRDDLHCDAVHIVGGDPDRLELAARAAVELGLEVWFSPYPLDLAPAEMVALFADCARRAERVRQAGGEVVFVTGVELTLMARGFLPGDDITARLDHLLGQPEKLGERVADASARLNAFLADAIATVREHFRGKLTYACVPLERVDWTPFDYLSVELIRSAEVAGQFREGVRTLVGQGKPVAITGFGTATWRGAPEVAPRSMEIVEYDDAGEPVALIGDYERDEDGQADYLRDLLEIFDSEGVDSVFVYLFALYNFPHRPDEPRRDLDLASLGVVKVLDGALGETYPDMPWEPKAAFAALAEYFSR
ncbi:hypothetical protein BLA60_18425 [Actinophytocola xinjiangensis]|uniref:Abortive infection protein n=1 Tax=Actinophytocola xinjiangensis TaxID=485602 RepID=A0A7Z0WL51_9PSEU|nr:hypothetical protein [Actinophytocola xinjiangensis]OLF09856.1 hypothetical protein BLA60_18425 [Actinophytocola xinjiangensis]